MYDLSFVWNATLDSYAGATGDVEFTHFGPLSVWLSQVITYTVVGVFFTYLDVYHRPEKLYRTKIQVGRVLGLFFFFFFHRTS